MLGSCDRLDYHHLGDGCAVRHTQAPYDAWAIPSKNKIFFREVVPVRMHIWMLTVALLSLCNWASAADLINETFEGIGPLKAFVSPTESNGDGTDWTDQLPAGWSMEFPSPIGNPIEFQGWRVFDVDSWVATEGNQDRIVWTDGGVGTHGQALVADADAYDDGTDIDTAKFNAYVKLPAIDLSTVAPNSINVSFDSFWKNETTQMGKVDVSYDGGVNFTNVLTYDSAVLANDEIINKRESLAINNPGAGSLVVRFGLVEGSNDWWWAIDDVTVSGSLVPEPSSATLAGGLALALSGFVRRRKAS